MATETEPETAIKNLFLKYLEIGYDAVYTYTTSDFVGAGLGHADLEAIRGLTIAPDMSLSWFGLFNRVAHDVGDNRWDFRSDLVGGLCDNVVVAIPLLIDGQERTLGLGRVWGQEGDHGCAHVTASWPTDARGDYRATSQDRVWSRSSLEILCGGTLGDFPTHISSGARKYLSAMVEYVLVAITSTTLEYGFYGLRAAAPELEDWFREALQVAGDAVEESLS